MVSIEDIVLLTVPFLHVIATFVLDRYIEQKWVIRKFTHTGSMILTAIYGVFLNSVEQFVQIFGILVVLFTLLSLPPIKMVQRLTKTGIRTGESRMLLFINASLTMATMGILRIIFDNYLWIFFSAVLMVGIGDSLGEFIGRPYGKHQYKIFSQKSLEGSLAVFVGCLLVGITTLAIFDLISGYNTFMIILIVFIITGVEASSVYFVDNISIPVIYSILAYVIIPT